MLDWIAANATLVQAASGLLTVVIWVVYLQLFLVSYLRQRRPEILISRGAGVGMDARCYIANLGLEPIYVSQLLMSVDTPDGSFEAAITDRDKMTEEQKRDPMHATNQGPLRSGDSYDAGNFGELVARTLRSRGLDEETPVQGFELTVVALHAASAAFIGGYRRYEVVEDGELAPNTLETLQMRSFLARRRLKAKLKRDLSWYRS